MANFCELASLTGLRSNVVYVCEIYVKNDVCVLIKVSKLIIYVEAAPLVTACLVVATIIVLSSTAFSSFLLDPMKAAYAYCNPASLGFI